MPFVTAGDPDLAATARLARTLADYGAICWRSAFPTAIPSPTAR